MRTKTEHDLRSQRWLFRERRRLTPALRNAMFGIAKAGKVWLMPTPELIELRRMRYLNGTPGHDKQCCWSLTADGETWVAYHARKD